MCCTSEGADPSFPRRGRHPGVTVSLDTNSLIISLPIIPLSWVSDRPCLLGRHLPVPCGVSGINPAMPRLHCQDPAGKFGQAVLTSIGKSSFRGSPAFALRTQSSRIRCVILGMEQAAFPGQCNPHTAPCAFQASRHPGALCLILIFPQSICCKTA